MAANSSSGSSLPSLLTTNASGQKVSEQRYKPYGEVRWSSGGMPTDFKFTSQRAGPANYVGSLMDYVARGYSPALGRFVSADTIVPGAGNPLAFNRYMYVLGRPLNLTDPDGKCPICGVAAWWITMGRPTYGHSADPRGVILAVSMANEINAASQNGVHPTLIAGAIAVQSQWCCYVGDWVTEFYQDNPSLGYAQLRRSEMERFGEGDARDTAAAMRGMSKKIAGALAGCDNRCTQTDRLIIAGIAQNESWGAEGARALLNNSEFRFDGRAGLDWVKILKTYAPETDWRNGPRAQGVSWIFFVLRQYIFDVLLLADLGWEMPKDVDISYLKCIAAGDQVCKQ